MKQQLMIHIETQLKLHLKINTKKAVGEINSTFINIHQYKLSIYSPNKLYYICEKNNKIFLLIQ